MVIPSDAQRHARRCYGLGVHQSTDSLLSTPAAILGSLKDSVTTTATPKHHSIPTSLRASNEPPKATLPPTILSRMGVGPSCHGGGGGGGGGGRSCAGLSVQKKGLPSWKHLICSPGASRLVAIASNMFARAPLRSSRRRRGLGSRAGSRASQDFTLLAAGSPFSVGTHFSKCDLPPDPVAHPTLIKKLDWSRAKVWVSAMVNRDTSQVPAPLVLLLSTTASWSLAKVC